MQMNVYQAFDGPKAVEQSMAHSKSFFNVETSEKLSENSQQKRQPQQRQQKAWNARNKMWNKTEAFYFIQNLFSAIRPFEFLKVAPATVKQSSFSLLHSSGSRKKNENHLHSQWIWIWSEYEFRVRYKSRTTSSF